MELTLIYICSQVFTILSYILLAITYYSKNRKKVLIISILSTVFMGAAYVLLKADSGLAMNVIALLRNIIFLIDENKNGKRDVVNKNDIIILVLLYVISIICAIFTYDGFFSLLSVFATMLYTYSVFQKKTKVYKMLGIPVGILWILYNVYIQSVMGIILESTLLICSATGYLLEAKQTLRKQDLSEEK